MNYRELIKQFNISSREYLMHRTEDHYSTIQRTVQILAASSDITTFDFCNKDVVDFFVNLHELMMLTDINSSIMWTSVNVLIEACKNPNTRDKLIQTYRFIPVLTRLIRDEQGLTEKNIKVLQLLQELSYGVKISWQEGYLTRLISILANWIMGTNLDLILISLGVLVNLCYKNVPAVYSLMRSVDIKVFIKTVLKLQNTTDPLRVQVCKLLIILQDVSGGVPDPEVTCYIKSTCPTLIEALKQGSVCLMRHIVSFFQEIVNNPKTSHIVSSYTNFEEDTKRLLNAINIDEIPSNCAAVLFDYLRCLVNLECLGLENLYPRILKLALRWTSTDEISTDCLKLICCIVSRIFLMPEDNVLLKTLIDLLDEHTSVLLLIVVVRDGNLQTNETYIKLNAVLKLLSELLKIEKLSDKIICSVHQAEIGKLFAPLKNPTNRDANFFQEPVYTFFVQALIFLTELAEKETSWYLLFRELLRLKQVQTVLAAAMYTGSEEIKEKVLNLTRTTGFSPECIGLLAVSMSELNKLIIFSPSDRISDDHTTTINDMSPLDLTPLMTITQEGYLSNLLEKYEHSAKRSNNLMLSSLMELYQYKIATMAQTIRFMQSSQEAADLRATRLQHSLALTSTEVSSLHQLLHITQQNLEATTMEATKTSAKCVELENQSKEIHKKYDQVVQNLRSKTRIITEQNEHMEHLKGKVKEGEGHIELLRDELNTLTNMYEENKKENETNLKKIVALKKEILAQSDVITELERSNSEKETEIGKLCKDLQEEKKTRERILGIAMGKT